MFKIDKQGRRRKINKLDFSKVKPMVSKIKTISIITIFCIMAASLIYKSINLKKTQTKLIHAEQKFDNRLNQMMQNEAVLEKLEKISTRFSKKASFECLKMYLKTNDEEILDFVINLPKGECEITVLNLSILFDKYCEDYNLFKSFLISLNDFDGKTDINIVLGILMNKEIKEILDSFKDYPEIANEIAKSFANILLVEDKGSTIVMQLINRPNILNAIKRYEKYPKIQKYAIKIILNHAFRLMSYEKNGIIHIHYNCIYNINQSNYAATTLNNPYLFRYLIENKSITYEELEELVNSSLIRYRRDKKKLDEWEVNLLLPK